MSGLNLKIPRPQCARHVVTGFTKRTFSRIRKLQRNVFSQHHQNQNGGVLQRRHWYSSNVKIKSWDCTTEKFRGGVHGICDHGKLFEKCQYYEGVNPWNGENYRLQDQYLYFTKNCFAVVNVEILKFIKNLRMRDMVPFTNPVTIIYLCQCVSLLKKYQTWRSVRALELRPTHQICWVRRYQTSTSSHPI